MDITPIVAVASSIAATLVTLLVFAAGWFAASFDRARIPGGGELPPNAAFDVTAANRITMADLRQRLRRLEAIADGIDP